MTTSKCEKKLGGAQTPKGIRTYIRTTSSSTVDCNVTPSSSRYQLKIENHNKYAVGVRVECESCNGDVEFLENGTASTNCKSSIFMKPRSTKPEVENLNLKIRPSHQNTTNDEIRTKINVNKIVISTNPDMDEKIKVDVN